jgi:putative membrane protein
MLHTDQTFLEAIEARVSAIERTTDAEIVVVAAARSDAYTELPERAASLVAFGVLVALVASPWTFHPLSACAELVVVWFATAWAVRHAVILRRLVPAARAAEAVRRAARAEFVEEAVHATPDRTGVLVYVSALEARVEVLFDLGIQGRVPAAQLAEAASRLSATSLDALLAGLDALGATLAEHIPHHAGSDDTNLPNAPRVRP